MCLARARQHLKLAAMLDEIMPETMSPRRIYVYPEDRDELRQRIHELEQALRSARALAEQHRRRAELAEATARRAWSLANWVGHPADRAER